jgi:3-phosphoshikimate 1-carboxyvinyltransferase
MTLDIQPISLISGEIRPPSDKSLTHRSYMFGAIASGPSVVRNPLRGEDCESTLSCLAQLGLKFSGRGTDEVRLFPNQQWIQPESDLDCGNSGTTMRLLSGLIASRPIHCRLIGDASLSRRPMKRIGEPLRWMGATIEGETPPLTISGAQLVGIDYESPVASAQVKSCVLLAGLLASGRSQVSEPSLSRDHTERMLRATGVKISQSLNGSAVSSVEGGQTPTGFEISVPADISSAAFFLVAASLFPGSRLQVLDLSINPTRTGILDVLTQCGIEFELRNLREQLGEPVADLTLHGRNDLTAFEISGTLVPRLIDEIPVLSVLATQCEGTSIIRDARELRVKESDRIETVANGLRKMGAIVETFDDGMAITGPTKLHGSNINGEGDHRIAMAFAIGGLIADGTTRIDGAESIFTSYPSFTEDLQRLSIV